MDFLTALKTVGILLAMAIPGYIIAKTKLINSDNAVTTLSVILLYVCQPFITVNSFLNTNYSGRILINLIFIFLLTTILMTALFFIGEGIFFKDKGLQKRDVFAFSGSLGNIGYMCIPFLQALTNNNSEIILYATCSLVGFNLVAWTLGSYFITKDKKYISLKNAFLNPPTISFLLILPFFILNLNFIRFPALSSIANACGLFANLTAPLSMMILGIRFSQIKIKELFDDYRVIIVCAIKLLLSPVLAFGLYKLFGHFIDLSGIRLNLIALSAMPAATNIMMFCSLYKSDGKSAAKAVLLSSVLSVITIPVALFLFV